MVLLAIDTSTAAIGAALHDGTTVRASVIVQDARRHGEMLAPSITRALAEAGIDRSELTRVACGVGPGPFTGLRVGIVTAQVLAHSLDLPAPTGICSLDALAHELVGQHQGPLLVATDARRREVYWARYDVDPAGARRVEGPAVDKAAELPEEIRALPVVGRGAVLYPEALPQRVSGPEDVDPGSLADLATALLAGAHPDTERALLPAEPLYLRRPDAVAPASPPHPLHP